MADTTGERSTPEHGPGPEADPGRDASRGPGSDMESGRGEGAPSRPISDAPAAPRHGRAHAARPVGSRRGSRALRLVGVAVAVVLGTILAFAAVVLTGPPSVDDLLRESGLDDRRELLIGVKDDQPGVAFRDTDGVWSGFDIDIAHMIAEDLGFRPNEVRFYAIESEDRARMQATDDKKQRVGVDLVIASYSITPEREADNGVMFSAPYLSTEQSVLTLANHPPVAGLEDLRGRKVCSLATATSVTAASQAEAVVIPRKRVSECFTALDKGEVEAISTDAAILAGYKYRNYEKYSHHDIGLEATEAWGVNVGENEALRDLVNLTLYRSREDPADDRWEDAFDVNLRSEIDKNPGVPIAVAEQPRVKDKPNVREWPWERIEP
jgi:glutamate transport system substrate-binding protein